MIANGSGFWIDITCISFESQIWFFADEKINEDKVEKKSIQSTNKHLLNAPLVLSTNKKFV